MLWIRFFTILSVIGYGELKEVCGGHSDDDSIRWNAGVYVENENKHDLICFGTIINANAILTAASCLHDIVGELKSDKFFISVGKELGKTQNMLKVNAKDILVNSQYRGIRNRFFGDLALIKLGSKIGVEPICVDWGKDIVTDGVSGLQPIWDGEKVAVSAQKQLDDEECLDKLSGSFSRLLTNDKFCTKTNSAKLISGSGLAFYYPETQRWYLMGVGSATDNRDIALQTWLRSHVKWLSYIYADL